MSDVEVKVGGEVPGGFIVTEAVIFDRPGMVTRMTIGEGMRVICLSPKHGAEPGPPFPPGTYNVTSGNERKPGWDGPVLMMTVLEEHIVEWMLMPLERIREIVRQAVEQAKAAAEGAEDAPTPTADAPRRMQ